MRPTTTNTAMMAATYIRSSTMTPGIRFPRAADAATDSTLLRCTPDATPRLLRGGGSSRIPNGPRQNPNAELTGESRRPPYCCSGSPRGNLRAARGSMRRRRFALHPAQTVVVGFAAAIATGTVLLHLPISSTDGRPQSLVAALFTATSAVCVTGLTVLDTPTFWSPFGQVVILLLIRLGGLGIMIFAALIGLVLARKMSLRSRLNMATETKVVGYDDVRGWFAASSSSHS